MANGEVSTCSGTFYDSQGTSSNYLNNEDYVYTFYPQTTGNAVRAVFTSFALQSSTGCVNDYLIIYDGTSIRIRRSAMYCGTTSPGTITACNASGALTFRFHSDAATVAQGWQATMSCVTLTPAYCAASGSLCDEYISNVVIGTISNASGCSGGYSNYTSLSTQIYKGIPSSLAVTNGLAYSGDELLHLGRLEPGHGFYRLRGRVKWPWEGRLISLRKLCLRKMQNMEISGCA